MTESRPAGSVDLDNCEREPIHIPGSIQPHGLLLVVSDPDLVVAQVSTNLPELLGVAVEDALGTELERVLGAGPGESIRRTIASFSDLRGRNPLEVSIDVAGVPRSFDAILHREPNGTLLVELEVAYGPRPFSFPNTYLAVRSAVEELNRASTLQELYDVAARAVRDLTGFDRVMVYRYDHDYNGEVVAEAKRPDLNSFLGLHYPATDIPAQARALYEKNWIRLIADVDYRPCPIVPTLSPVSGRPLDLTYSTLRSVSPIHVEYLQNMGVGASMSISLLRNGTLWGLIACHHYSGAHLPPFGTRAAAEFLGSTLSLRLVDRYEDDQLRERIAAQGVLAKLAAGALDEAQTLADVYFGEPDLLDLVPADGVVLSVQDGYTERGTVPPRAVTSELAEWVRDGPDDLAATDCLASSQPSLELDSRRIAGALVVTLPDDGYVIWFRSEQVRWVDWGGDPHNKAIAAAEGDTVRLSPRKSFERWRETVREHSLPWSPQDTEMAAQLRRHAIEVLYRRARGELRLAEALQRSLLPTALPAVPGWAVSAHYEPAAGGRVGGDWYDLLDLSGDGLVVVLGDVAGHGIAAAGKMAQVRNVLRAYLYEGMDPAAALDRLNGFTCAMLRGTFATALVARLDIATGELTMASAGHHLPLLVAPDGSVSTPQVRVSPPVGVPDSSYTNADWVAPAGSAVVMFTDGLIERRGEDIDAGRRRLATLLRSERAGARELWERMTAGEGVDDATVLRLERD